MEDLYCELLSVAFFDEDAKDKLTYWVDDSKGMSVYGGAWVDTATTLGMKAFDIHPLFAQIVVANPVLNYEIHGAIRLQVRAQDESGFTDSAYITITLTNRNEGPVWLGGARGYSTEKCPAGWVILNTKTCCEQATGCTVKCAINQADSSAVTPDCANYAETQVEIVRPAGAERRRGCAIFEDGTINGACRIKADPVDHPNIGNGRSCTMTNNKRCASSSYYNDLVSRDVPDANSNHCLKK